MSNITAPVEVINFEGASSFDLYTPQRGLTGYTLPITPFTFRTQFGFAFLPDAPNVLFLLTDEAVPQYIITELLQETNPGYTITTEQIATNIVSDKRIVWDFGDGTFGTGLTAKHAYNKPGIYNVNTYYFNKTGGVYKNTRVTSITCYNFIQDGYTVSLSSQYITSNRYQLTAGRIINPFKIYSQSSWQNVGSGANFETTFGLNLLSGTTSFFSQNLNNNKYGHLYTFSSFYELDSDNSFAEINEAVVERTPIYCALSAGSLYYTTEDNVSAVFCGVSGTKLCYVKDDKVGTRNIVVFPKTFDYNNTIPIILDCLFVSDSIDGIELSSNGITGEGTVNTTFSIDPVKYLGQKINFMVTLKDDRYFTIKDYSNLTYDPSNVIFELPNINLVAIDESGNIDETLGTFATNFSYLSSITGGFYRGTFTPSKTANNIKIAAITNRVYSYLTLDSSDIFALDGPVFALDDAKPALTAFSSTFSVYSSAGKYSIAKVNEDFDFGGTLNSLRYQEFLTDKTVLFDDFLGTAFGNSTADPMSPGKLAYEKIANFTSNTSDIYKSNIQSLLSMNSMVGGNVDVRNTTNFGTPSKLKRLVDIVSINHSRLWGSKNSFNENFNNLLGADSEKYGGNLGAKLDFMTTVLSSGKDGYIVALERFSNVYTKCNTFINLLSTSVINPSLSTYALSSYNDTWGWGLLLNPGISGAQIPIYYDFYEFISTPEGSSYNNVINFNDPYTTVSYTNSSYESWIGKGGIIEEMIDHILYTGSGVLSTQPVLSS